MSSTGQKDARKVPQQYYWVALALAVLAGSVDGIGYMVLAHVFTSHMSGNTVAMTIHLAAGDWREAWRHFEPIVAFFLGIVVGLVAADLAARLQFSRVFASVTALELALLLAFLFLARPIEQWMVAFPAAAMGVQNALLRRVGHHRVRTTYITGMLTNTAQGLVAFFTSIVTRDGKARDGFSDFSLYGAIWLCFAAGGVSGAVLELHTGVQALLLPISGLAALLVLDAVTPLTRS